MRMLLRPGDNVSVHDMSRQLTAMQYARAELDFKRGTFRVRGDSLDIFSRRRNMDAAVRVSMFDDEIDGLTLFDPLTGHTLQSCRFTVYAKSHYVTPRETILGALDGIKAELRDRVAYFVRRTNWSRRSASSNAHSSTWKC